AFPPRRSAASVTAEGIPEQRNEALLARIVAPALFRRGRQRVFRAPFLLVADLDPEARPVALAGHGALGAARRAQRRFLHLAVAGKGRQERLQLQELGRGNRRRRRGEEQKDRVAHTRHPLHAPFWSARAACPVCDRKGRSRRRATSARRNIAVKIMRRYVGKTESGRPRRPRGTDECRPSANPPNPTWSPASQRCRTSRASRSCTGRDRSRTT